MIASKKLIILIDHEIAANSFKKANIIKAQKALWNNGRITKMLDKEKKEL